MGIVTAQRLADLRETGLFLGAFAVGMPSLSGALGTATGVLMGLSVGGTTVLATMAASASYIAAPAANPTFYLTASLGITFPFNLTFGIPIYYWLAQVAHHWKGAAGF